MALGSVASGEARLCHGGHHERARLPEPSECRTWVLLRGVPAPQALHWGTETAWEHPGWDRGGPGVLGDMGAARRSADEGADGHPVAIWGCPGQL